MKKLITAKPVKAFSQLSKQERWFLATSAITFFFGQASARYPHQLVKGRQVAQGGDYSILLSASYYTTEKEYSQTISAEVVKKATDRSYFTFLILRVGENSTHFEYSCSCEDFKERPHRPCKHVIATAIKYQELLFRWAKKYMPEYAKCLT